MKTRKIIGLSLTAAVLVTQSVHAQKLTNNEQLKI